MRRHHIYQSISALIAGFFVFSVPVVLSGETLRVPGQFATIQDAIDAANDGDVVELSIGVFRGEGNRDIRLHGKAITIRGEFGPEFSAIDAEGTPQEPYRGFIFDSGETVDTVIEGLTISGGATLPGAIADPFNGGGLFFLNSSATVRNCIIDNNQCGCWGGGVYISGNGAAPVLVNCSISGNLSGDDGGAVFVWNSARVTLVNCNLNHNEGTVTGGAFTGFSGNTNIRSQLINCNLIGNHANYGGAVYAFNTDITNSIVWGNTGNADQIEGGSDLYVTYSIVDGGYDGQGNLNSMPLFVNPAAGDYRLHAGSPAIDAANNEVIPADVLTDIYGNSRFHDDQGMADAGLAGGQSAVADLGPSEFQGQTIYKFGRAPGN